MWLLGFVGCIYVEKTVWDDTGTDSGAETWTWATDSELCASDTECPGNYACSSPSVLTDAHGCVERCSSDYDCKGGYSCDGDGACT